MPSQGQNIAICSLCNIACQICYIDKGAMKKIITFLTFKNYTATLVYKKKIVVMQLAKHYFSKPHVILHWYKVHALCITLLGKLLKVFVFRPPCIETNIKDVKAMLAYCYIIVMKL